MAEFVLDVQDIDEAGKAYDFAVRGPWLAEVLAGTGVWASDGEAEGRLRVWAFKQGQDVVIEGRVRAALRTECARCLEEAAVPVDAPIHALLTARGADLRPEPDERELSPEDLLRDFFEGDRIVLDATVREHLLLEVPIKPLCEEDCPGIPVPEAVSGPDLASPSPEGIDPRLAPLLSLVGRVKPTEE